MEIEVGEWVRTKAGVIAKVCAYQDLVTYDNKGISVTFHSFDTNKGAIADINIAKHSKNIIDLIEVGDIVEVLVNKRTNEILRYTLDTESDLYLLRKESIKTILTHEQYEQNCYRLEE